MNGCKTKLRTPRKPLINLTPTDVALWMRMGRCDRLISLRQAERKNEEGYLFSDIGVLPQQISPLLSTTGRMFEQLVEEATRTSHDITIDCRTTDAPNGDSPERRDGNRFIHTVRSLSPGTNAVLLQARLEERNLWGWNVLGDIDLVRLELTHSGELHCLIADSKASGNPKPEHYVQLAFYRAMVLAALKRKRMVSTSVDIGVIYRGDSISSTFSHRTEAKRIFGLHDAYLAIAPDPELYHNMARELVEARNAPVRRAMEQAPESANFCFGLPCVGCRYTAWCCKSADARLDLSLIPHLLPRVKRALIGAGVHDIVQLAALKERQRGNTQKSMDRINLVVATGQEDTVQKLALTPAGPVLDALVLRAQTLLSQREYDFNRADGGKILPILHDQNHAASEADKTK